MSRAVWVFNVTGQYEFFPEAVFSSRKEAEEWIYKEKIDGILTKYLLNTPKGSSFPEHYHYEDEDDFKRLEKVFRETDP